MWCYLYEVVQFVSVCMCVCVYVWASVPACETMRWAVFIIYVPL